MFRLPRCFEQKTVGEAHTPVPPRSLQRCPDDVGLLNGQITVVEQHVGRPRLCTAVEDVDRFQDGQGLDVDDDPGPRETNRGASLGRAHTA